MNTRIRRRQRGFSLIVSLVLLVLITLVAVGSMRATAMQTRMSATTHDRTLAFQAAETALREAEAAAIAATPSGYPSSGCTGLLCATPAAGSTPRWNDSAFAGWVNAVTAVSAQAATPQAYTEYVGQAPNWDGCMNEMPRQPNCISEHYRVTARSTAEGRASVLLQSEAVAP